MTTTTNRDSSRPIAAGKALEPDGIARPNPRVVSFEFAPTHDGLLPVTVTVAPTSDLDAKGDLFIDFRSRAKVRAAHGIPARPGGSDTKHISTRQKGNNAIEALAASEATAEAATRSRRNANKTLRDEMAAPEPGGESSSSVKQELVSHQIAQAIKLTVGQVETFRAEVAVPASPVDPSNGWYARGRLATLGGKDVTSGWRRI